LEHLLEVVPYKMRVSDLLCICDLVHAS